MTNPMSVKKINGYKIMMDTVLGQGSYGTVNLHVIIGI